MTDEQQEAVNTLQKKLVKTEVTPEDILESAKRLVSILEARTAAASPWHLMRGRLAKDLRDKLDVVLGDKESGGT